MSNEILIRINAELGNIGYVNDRLANFFPNNRNLNDPCWTLSIHNKYFKSSNLDTQIKSSLLSSSTASITTNDLGELANLSSFNHYFDGFNYFKSFLKSALNSDFKVSAHLLYYAELRWLQALLNSQGLISFDRIFLATTNTGIKRFRTLDSSGGSHQKKWALFQAWASTNSADNLIKQAFKVQGETINDWLNAGSAPYTGQLILDWITSIHNPNLPYLEDRDFRNRVTYRGYEDFSKFEEPRFLSSIEFLLDEVNEILSLEENGTFFEKIDAEIFFMLISQQFSNRDDRVTSIKNFFTEACRNLGKNEELAKELSNKVLNETSLSERLQGLADSTDIDTLKFMFYRAVLLMRLAASSLSNNLKLSGKQVKDFDPWFRIKLQNSPWISKEDLFEDSHFDYSYYLDLFKRENREKIQNNSPTTLWQLEPKMYTDLLKLSDLDIAAAWSLA